MEAKIKIMQLHSLANTPIEKAFPWIYRIFKCFGCCRHKKKTNDERKELDELRRAQMAL